MRIAILLILGIFTCSRGLNAQAFYYDFADGDQGFAGGVSDYSHIQADQVQFHFEHIKLPAPLDTGQSAQFVSGFNCSDDLFMFLKRQITGLQPYTQYAVTFEVEFASIYPTNAIGVGGAPGEAVTMKAGLVNTEPLSLLNVISEYRMNIDKGNQSQPGPDMDTIGHVGVSDTTSVYALKTNSNAAHPFIFTTDSTGSAWLIVGTDSGFESTTALYYTHIAAGFEILSAVAEPEPDNVLMAFPNPATGRMYWTAPDSFGRPVAAELCGIDGRCADAELKGDYIELPASLKGLYWLRLTNAGGRSLLAKIACY